MLAAEAWESAADMLAVEPRTPAMPLFASRTHGLMGAMEFTARALAVLCAEGGAGLNERDPSADPERREALYLDAYERGHHERPVRVNEAPELPIVSVSAEGIGQHRSLTVARIVCGALRSRGPVRLFDLRQHGSVLGERTVTL